MEVYNKHEIKWAHGFLYGLVQPALMKAEEECEHGLKPNEISQLRGILVVQWYLHSHAYHRYLYSERPTS